MFHIKNPHLLFHLNLYFRYRDRFYFWIFKPPRYGFTTSMRIQTWEVFKSTNAAMRILFRNTDKIALLEEGKQICSVGQKL